MHLRINLPVVKPMIRSFRSCRSVGEGDFIAVARNASVPNDQWQSAFEIAGSLKRALRSYLRKEGAFPGSAGHPRLGMLSKPMVFG